jgi:superfamily II DNA or RNA helicase
MLQIPHTTFAVGDRVRVRDDRWRVEEVRAYRDCKLLRLSGIGNANRGAGCALLVPFDRPTPLNVPVRLRVTTRARWMRAFRALELSATPFGQLRAPGSASLEVYAYQLEPALAAVQGLSSRILIADEVGLGKTVQAGLILAELRSRGWADRTLILTPAGLRDQWAGELERRFGIRAAVMDSCAVRWRTSQLPAGVNPWTLEAVSIASVDAIKRPETVQALAAIVWDLLLVDEAHLVVTAPQRAAAVQALAERARRIVLLTATPHAGDERAFVSLCDIGRLRPEQAILLFRRTRKDAGLAVRRRVHLLAVRLSTAERRMQHLLGRYAGRIWREASSPSSPDARLVAVVLSKRALSSASSLARSVERRLQLLPRGVATFTQAALPLDAPDGELGEADAEPALAFPALADPDRERDLLRAILEAAREAARSETKLLALGRLLRRAREPAVVFTEYRDTLETAASTLAGSRRSVCLHGGLDERERRAVLDAFNTGDADLLLATDTGGEGLNLQARCRLVINLELPWNPVRLEQRIGRVDRLGQSRAVHAVNLFARGTPEASVLARLFIRLERARKALGPVNDPVCSPGESEIAAAVISNCPLDGALPNRSAVQASSGHPAPAVDLRAEASAEARRLLCLRQSIRRVARDGSGWPRAWPGEFGGLDVPVAAVPRRRLRTGEPLGHSPGIIWLFRAQAAEANGRCLEEMVIPVRLRIPIGSAIRSRFQMRNLLRPIYSRLQGILSDRAEAVARARLDALAPLREEALVLARSRERAIGELLRSARPALVQAGLFDGRALNTRNEARRIGDAIQAQVDSRMSLLDGPRLVNMARPVELAMVLIVHDGRL